MTNVNSTPLFPLEGEVYLEAIEKFSEFNDDELALLDAANLTLLPEGSASRYVLEFNLRPVLREGLGFIDELRRHAYRTGVLLGRRAIRNSIELIDDAEYAMMSPRHMRQIEKRTNKGKEFIPPQEKGFSGWVDRRFAKIDPNYAFYPYLRIQDEAFQGRLRQVWLRSGISYFTAEAIQQNVDDEIPRGMKDLFRVFALLDTDKDKNWQVKAPEVLPVQDESAVTQELGARSDTKVKLVSTSQLIEVIESLENRSPELQECLVHLYGMRAHLEKIDKLERRSVLLGKLTVPVAVGVPLAGAVGAGFIHASPVIGFALSGAIGAGAMGTVRALPYLERLARRSLHDA